MTRGGGRGYTDRRNRTSSPRSEMGWLGMVISKPFRILVGIQGGGVRERLRRFRSFTPGGHRSFRMTGCGTTNFAPRDLGERRDRAPIEKRWRAGRNLQPSTQIRASAPIRGKGFTNTSGSPYPARRNTACLSRSRLPDRQCPGRCWSRRCVACSGSPRCVGRSRLRR
jgi:hypothetical protein